jgi:RNA polymerase sigma-54 factor
MTQFSETDKQIAQTIIDAISDDGYLNCSLEEIQQLLSRTETTDSQDPTEDSRSPDLRTVQVEIDEIQAVLHHIQNFDPPGVGARDLSECLKIQLKLLDPATPSLQAATAIATPDTLALLATVITFSCGGY